MKYRHGRWAGVGKSASIGEQWNSGGRSAGGKIGRLLARLEKKTENHENRKACWCRRRKGRCGKPASGVKGISMNTSLLCACINAVHLRRRGWIIVRTRAQCGVCATSIMTQAAYQNRLSRHHNQTSFLHSQINAVRASHDGDFFMTVLRRGCCVPQRAASCVVNAGVYEHQNCRARNSVSASRMRYLFRGAARLFVVIWARQNALYTIARAPQNMRTVARCLQAARAMKRHLCCVRVLLAQHVENIVLRHGWRSRINAQQSVTGRRSRNDVVAERSVAACATAPSPQQTVFIAARFSTITCYAEYSMTLQNTFAIPAVISMSVHICRRMA